jgi:hypothetical protein
MPDVLLANDDITVLGPPEILEVLVDIGPTGERGSKVFVGLGDPNSVEIGQEIKLNDLYINAAQGLDYGYLYQYVAEPGSNTWVQVLKVSPVLYSKIHSVNFTAGAGSITIPILNIVSATGTPLTAANFNVQYSIAYTKPLASSMSVPPLTGGGTNLVINLSAVEFRSNIDSGPYEDWSLLNNETVAVHLFISIV